MKRVLTVSLMMMLILSLAGCGSSDSEAQTGEETAEQSAGQSAQEETEDDRNWSDSEIASYLAVPDSENIQILEDTDDYFSFEVTGASREDYETYVGGCRYIGFSEDVSESEDSFEAASDDGYKICISYDEANESYSGSIEPR